MTTDTPNHETTHTVRLIAFPVESFRTGADMVGTGRIV